MDKVKEPLLLKNDYPETFSKEDNTLKKLGTLQETQEALGKTLSMGVELHVAGEFDLARQMYDAVIKFDPNHADANHNMGLLKLDTGHGLEALPYLQTSLQADTSVAQFWLSYIKALIQLDRLDDASRVLSLAKESGAEGKEFKRIEEILGSSSSIDSNHFRDRFKLLKEQVNTFYTCIRSDVLNEAATGWLYDLRFDQKFLAKNEIEFFQHPEINTNKNASNFKEQNQDSVLKPSNIIYKLNEISCLKDKFHRLDSLNTSENKLLFADSFSGSSSFDLRDIQKRVFKKNQLNIVIIGAGPCGLYLSNALKYQFKNKINVLVLDNHCDERHFKKPFSRRWLSYLPMKYFDEYFDRDIGKLACSFGKDGYIGLPINLIEFLLFISSKKNGVKFYFDQTIDYSVFNSSLVDLVFDASGGRLPNTKQKMSLEKEIKIQIPNSNMNFSYAGIKNLPNINVNPNGNFSVTLKKDGYYHHPYFNGIGLFLPMMKLTQLPTSLHPILMKFVQSLNNNRFYIWKGTLSDNINELLVIVNLTIAEYDYLKPIIRDVQKLSTDIIEQALENERLGPDLIDFLKVCVAHNDDPIYLSSPFVSKPSVNLEPLDQRINGIEVYPVGDSLFKGNPKVGNGLGTHLRNIAKLIGTLESAFESEEFFELHQHLNEPTVEVERVKSKADTSNQSNPNILDTLKLDKALRLAKNNVTKGSQEEAKRIYQDILKKFPKNKRAQQGLAALKEPQGPTANQRPPQEVIDQLINLYNQGKLSVAAEQSNALTEQYPESFIVWNIVGAANKGLGQVGEALEAFKKVTELNPTYADGYNNLGVTFRDQGKLEEAIEACNKALSLKPDYAEAHNNMGATLQEQGKLDEAIASFEKALSLKPDYAEASYNMGNALRDQGKLEEAIEACNKALSLKPDYAEAQHMVSSITGKTTTSAPKKYIENLFDGYSKRFEQSLVGDLEYTIPKLLTDIILKEHGSGTLGSVLDLGCGTGLTGLEIKDFCSNLEGIDLSKKMLELANAKNVYDKLIHTDIYDYLADTDLCFDYFIAADVLVYVGDLTELFRLIKSRNQQKGKLAFSTEKNITESFQLETTGRYSHSKSYIESLCKKFDFSLSHYSEVDLRKEKGTFLTGGLYLLSF